MRGERHAQCCGRVFARSHGRAEQHGKAAAVFGGELQAPQLGELRQARPDEHAAAGSRGQGLLCRPEGIAVLGRFDDEHAREFYAGSGKRRRIGQVGWGDPGDGFPFGGESRQSRAEEAQFAYAGALRQDFGERAAGPAAPGEFCIQDGKSGGQPGVRGESEMAAAPDAWMVSEFSCG